MGPPAITGGEKALLGSRRHQIGVDSENAVRRVLRELAAERWNVPRYSTGSAPPTQAMIPSILDGMSRMDSPQEQVIPRLTELAGRTTGQALMALSSRAW